MPGAATRNSGKRATNKVARERKSHIWKKHPDDWYVEPQWCAERLFQEVLFVGTIHDPCCGIGRIPFEAYKADYKFTASDIKYRLPLPDPDGKGPPFWYAGTSYQSDERIHDNIVCNPPFGAINAKPWPFIEWALAHVHHKVALLVPFKWFGGDKRTRYLETKPLTKILVMTPRPSMPPGPALLDMWKRGEEPGGGKEDFAWVIFEPNKKRRSPPTIGWLHRDKDA